MVVVTTSDVKSSVWVLLLVVAALPAWTLALAPSRLAVMPSRSPVPRLGRLAEIAITVIGVSDLVAAPYEVATATALLPYLLVPIAQPALEGRFGEAGTLIAAGTAGLFLGRLPDDLPPEPTYLIATGEWIVIAWIVAVSVYRGRHRFTAVRLPPPQPYVEAKRLLTQLRTVARQLPGATLDPGGIAEDLIDEVSAVAPMDRAAVLTGGLDDRLAVLAEAGTEQADWETSLAAESAIADAWATQEAQVSNRSQVRTGTPGTHVSSLVVPLVTEVRTVGLIVLEADRPAAYPPAVVRQVTATATAAALRLEAALLFDDVRSLATTEERQRLAREIHDGIAQELAQIGYGIDNAIGVLTTAGTPDAAAGTAAGEATDPTAPASVRMAEQELRNLRAEVTRVITELRMSLFELRSQVDRRGLTTAIAEYARTVGASSGMRVHFSVEESTARLPSRVEAELMRIAQEAITNARKHARAQNLWISCEVDPPYARIEIADDGTGMGEHRPHGRLGLAIMTERAQRIRGTLEIAPRPGGGTSVAVVVGNRAAPRSSSGRSGHMG